MPHLIKAIDYKTREERTFTLQLEPWQWFKVNAEQTINRMSDRHWTVIDMQPIVVSAPF